MEPHSTKTVSVLYSPKDQGLTPFTVKATSNTTLADSKTAYSTVISPGFERSVEKSSLLKTSTYSEEQNGDTSRLSLNFELPSSLIDGSVTADGSLVASSLENMIAAAESLIKDPYGCFEQCSSVTYPMVLALKLLHKMEERTKDPQEL